MSSYHFALLPTFPSSFERLRARTGTSTPELGHRGGIEPHHSRTPEGVELVDVSPPCHACHLGVQVAIRGQTRGHIAAIARPSAAVARADAQIQRAGALTLDAGPISLWALDTDRRTKLIYDGRPVPLLHTQGIWLSDLGQLALKGGLGVVSAPCTDVAGIKARGLIRAALPKGICVFQWSPRM